MNKYKVYIVETLVRTVEVEANTKSEAIEKVEEMYRNEEIILDYMDHFDTEFIAEE